MIGQMLIFLTAAQLSVHMTEGAVAFGKAETHPDHPNSCYISSTGDAHAIGSAWPMENACGKVTCEGSESGDLFVHYATCGTVHVSGPCKLVSNLALPYPQCCPTPVCEADTIDIADIAQNDNNITQNDSNLSQNDIENEVSRRKISDNNDEELVSYDISMEDGPVTFEEETRNMQPFEVNSTFESVLPR